MKLPPCCIIEVPVLLSQPLTQVIGPRFHFLRDRGLLSQVEGLAGRSSSTYKTSRATEPAGRAPVAPVGQASFSSQSISGRGSRGVSWPEQEFGGNKASALQQEGGMSSHSSPVTATGQAIVDGVPKIVQPNASSHASIDKIEASGLSSHQCSLHRSQGGNPSAMSSTRMQSGEMWKEIPDVDGTSGCKGAPTDIDRSSLGHVNVEKQTSTSSSDSSDESGASSGCEVLMTLQDFADAPLDQFCAVWGVQLQEWREYNVHWWRTHGIQWGGVNMQIPDSMAGQLA
jgi:hypothetical protein